MKLSHSELCQLAVKWLRRRKENNCMGFAQTCKVVASEVVSSNGEIPDVIGFSGGTSILFECKTSYSDYLRDFKKIHRIYDFMGMGDYRYFLTPPSLIRIDQLLITRPDWGLIETDGKRFNVINWPALQEKIDKRAEQRLLLSMIRNPNRKGIWLK